MRHQDRYTVCRASRHSHPIDPDDERVAFRVDDRMSIVRIDDLAYAGSVHLPLLEETLRSEPEAFCKPHAILSNRCVVVTEVKAQVQRVVRRLAHTARSRRKRVTETVTIQKGGMQCTHSVCSSMANLRRPQAQARQADPKSGHGVGFLHRFPSEEWTAAYKVALNNNRAYRDAGRPWNFGPVAIVVRGDASAGLEQDACVILDVHEGRCRDAQFVKGSDDPKAAKFVIVASYARWKEVIEGRLDPIKGMMQGKLKLSRGHLPTIIRRVESARQLVVSACRVPTQFGRERADSTDDALKERP